MKTDFLKGLVITSIPLVLMGLFIAKPVKASEYVLTDQGTSYEGSCHMYGNMGEGGKIPNHNGDGYNAYWYVSNLGDAIPHKISIHWNGARVLLTTNTDLDSYYQISFSYPSDPTGINGYGFGLYLCSGTDTYPSTIIVSDVVPFSSAEVKISNPQNGDLVNPNFQSWITTFQLNDSVNSISASTPGKLLVKYWKGSATSSPAFVFTDSKNVYSTSSILDSNFHLIEKSNNLSNSSVWSAYVELRDYASSSAYGAVIASSSVISFNVDSSVPEQFPVLGGLNPIVTPSSTATSGDPFYVDCSAYDSTGFWGTSISGAGIACNFQKMLYAFVGWLFVPPESASEDLARALNFSNVIPFNIIFGVKDGIEINNTVVASTQNSDSLSVGMLGNSVTLVSSTSLVDFMTSDLCDVSCATQNKENMFNWIKVGSWVITGIVAGMMLF